MGRNIQATRCLSPLRWLIGLIWLVCGLGGLVSAQDAPRPTTLPPIPSGSTVDAETVRKLVEHYVKEAEAKRKAEEKAEKEKKDKADKEQKEKVEKKEPAESKAVEVGSNLSLNGIWDNGLFFISPNKDWRIHIGGRYQFNSVWWQQPAALKQDPPGLGGVPSATRTTGTGVGPLDDGTYFRRVRFRADGTCYETVEFMCEVDFENINLLAFDHMWVGMKDVPFLGTVRIGQHKVPQGLDMVGSDYHLTFLERSSLSEAFLTLFAPGVYVSNTFCDQNVTTHAMFHRVQPLQYYDGVAFGDGDYAWTGRLTWTPLYEQDGAHVIHVGGSYQWRRGNLGRSIFPGTTGNTFADTQQIVRFRSRPELRDGVGILTPIVGGNQGRFVDTGVLIGDNVRTMCPEFMATLGPLNLRAEAAFAVASNVRSVYPAAAFNRSRGDLMFWGGYVQASYFLTGEHWGYDRRFGVYDRPRVNENAFCVQGECQDYHHGLGAWEVAYRFSYIDLNDDSINGGQLLQNTFGINWYLNDNFRLQANYLDIHRNVIVPSHSGTMHALGIQAQYYF